jgi:T5SS/PEP-CTERM-associated repeat protein
MTPWIPAQAVCSALLFFAVARACAGTFAWKNPPANGAFNAASSWKNADGGGGYPGAGDDAIFISGAYTVTCVGSVSGSTEVIGAVTFQLDGDYTVGTYVQGGNPVVLRGGATLGGGPFTIADDGRILVDGSGLTMNRFTFGTRTAETRLTGVNGAQINSSGQHPDESLPSPRLEGGSQWHHTGALNVGRCFINSGALLSADTLSVNPAELDGGRLQAGRLNGGGHAKNGSNVSADTASLSDWLLEGSGTGMHVSGTTVKGLIYADISMKSGATFSAGAIEDSGWYTVDGSGSQLTVATSITADGPQKVTVLNQGRGSADTLNRTYVIVRDPGSLFAFATLSKDTTLDIRNGGRVNGAALIGPTIPGNVAGCAVTGAGSAVVLSGNLDLGQAGQGSLDVSDGGRAECATGYLNGGQPGGSATSSVYGTGSFWLARNGLVVGDKAGSVNLYVDDGGRVEVRDQPMALGARAGSEGRMTVNGGSSPSPSALDTRLSPATGVGVNGKGFLRVVNRGRILAGRLTLGSNAGSDGTLEVVGAGTSLETSDTLEIGRAGSGHMTISSGGAATAPDVLIGSNSATNLLRLTGTDSTLTIAKAIRVGNTGIGNLTIEQGARVVLTGTYAEPDSTETGLCWAGANAGATGTIAVNGAGSALLGTRGFLNLGLVASATLTVTGGGEVNFAAISVVGGRKRSSSATISGVGSVVSARDSLSIGAPFPGPDSDEVTVTAGGLLASKSTLAVGRTGVLRLSGGSTVIGQTSEAPIPGTLLVANRGLFLLGGRVIGSVAVRPGGVFLPGFSPGKATIEGNLTLAAGSALEVELGGTGAGAGYDQIEAAGTVTLAGHLDIVFRDGFAPTNGQVFDVVKGGAVLGGFSEVTVSGLATGFTYSLANTGGNTLTLVATSAGTADSQPKLSIAQATGATLIVSWPEYVNGWTLQQSAELAAGSWRPVSAPGNTLTVPAALGATFFRLTSP